MVVWDQSQSQASRDYVSRYDGSQYVSVRRFVQSYGEIERAIDRREALMALIVPVNFADRVGSGKDVGVQLVVDGSDSNTATIAMGYADAINNTYAREVRFELIRRRTALTFNLPVDLRPRVWFNADLQSRNYIIPGLIAVIMMVIAALLTSLTIAREWETGTMEQLLSTPVKAREMILGKLIPYFGIGMTDVLLAVLMGQYVFHVPLRGSVALLFGMGAVFLAGALSLGMLISIVTRSQLLASQIALVTTFLPAFLLSGFVFDISNMPVVLRILTRVIPARYFVTLLKGIYMKGVGLEVMALEAVLLAGFAVVIVLVAGMKFQKKIV
jgi:ABC-2 type transport system permease protein